MDKLLNVNRVQVIVNPASGQPEPVLHTLNRVFNSLDLEWDVAVSQKDGDARRLAEEAAAAGGIDVVAAYGGDGTVMEIAQGLMGSKVPLAILPGGTANLMSVELGIPRNLEQAARLIGDPNTAIQLVDMGQAGDRLFMLRVGMGSDAEMFRLADREQKDRFGVLAYIISGVEALFTAKVADYSITLDDQEIECKGFVCRIDNSGNFGVKGISIAPGISVTDGLLDLLILGNVDLKELYKTLASSDNDTAISKKLSEAYQHWQGREITVTADPPQLVHGDGEVWGETPISVKILPQALSVLVPSQ
jgi:YegS/Rv2252/BmrU family lipid kinase